MQKLYRVLMANTNVDVPFKNKVVVAILFTSFLVAFLIITAEFIYGNVRL